MPRQKITDARYRELVKELTNDEYSVLSKFETARNKIRMKHRKCRHEWEVTPSNFLYRSSRCPQCHGNLLLTTEMFKDRVESLVGSDYEVVSEYINTKTKIKLVHSIEECGYDFYMSPDSFLRGQRCPRCAGNTRYTTLTFRDKVSELTKGNYEIIDDYVDSQTKIKMRHIECNYEFNVIPSEFVRGQRCPKCVGSWRRSHSEFETEVFLLSNGEYLVAGEFVATGKRIKIQHTVCGEIYSVTPDSFFRGNRCPICNCSKGEKSIASYLNSRNINYLQQFKFGNCKYKKPLPFDFAVFDKNNGLLFLIEYDGIHHFKPVDFSSKKSEQEINSEFELIQLKDKIKTDYCLTYSIPLLRIPYKKFECIDEIISSALDTCHFASSC